MNGGRFHPANLRTRAGFGNLLAAKRRGVVLVAKSDARKHADGWTITIYDRVFGSVHTIDKLDDEQACALLDIDPRVLVC